MDLAAAASDTDNQFRIQFPAFSQVLGCVFPRFPRIVADRLWTLESGHGGNFTSFRRIPRGHLFEASLGYESIGEDSNGRRAPQAIVLRPFDKERARQFSERLHFSKRGNMRGGFRLSTVHTA